MNTYAPLNQVINNGGQKNLLGKSPSKQARFIFEDLKDYMAKGLLPVHSKLNLQVLKKKYAVSTGVVHAAIANLLDSRFAYKGRTGVFVAGLSLEELREILNLRFTLEKEAIKTAIAYGHDEWESHIVSVCHRLVRLEEKIVLQNLDGDIEWLKAWSSLYQDFHLALSSCAKLDVSVIFIGILYSQCEKYFLHSLLGHDLSLKNFSGHHEALKNAVLVRDVKLTEKLLSEHLEKIYQVVKGCIDTRYLN